VVGGYIDIRRLFADDQELNQTDFVEALRDQCVRSLLMQHSCDVTARGVHRITFTRRTRVVAQRVHVGCA
jgi:hypothetical protein